MAGIPDGLPISVHEASVRTAAVEIKTLTVRGRQVTQALFKQLACQPLIRLDPVSLAGTPWGRVSYFWGECEKRRWCGHMHVVWQEADELRRACVEPLDPPSDHGGRRFTFRDEHLVIDGIKADMRWNDIACLLISAATWPQEAKQTGEPGNRVFACRGWSASPQEVVRWVDQNDRFACQLPSNWTSYSGSGYRPENIAADVAKVLEVTPDAVTPALIAGHQANRAALESRLAAAKAKLQSKEQQYRRLFDQLAALPQLFIAC